MYSGGTSSYARMQEMYRECAVEATLQCWRAVDECVTLANAGSAANSLRALSRCSERWPLPVAAPPWATLDTNMVAEDQSIRSASLHCRCVHASSLHELRNHLQPAYGLVSWYGNGIIDMLF